MTFNYCAQCSQNSKSMLIMNITRITRNSTCLCRIISQSTNTTIVLLAVVLAPLLLLLAYQTQQCSRTHFSWSTSRIYWVTIHFCCKTLQSKKLTRLRTSLLNGVVLLRTLQDRGTRENRWRVNGGLLYFTSLCKEYLTVVKFKTIFLLLTKYWKFWCMDHVLRALMTSSRLKNNW